MSENRNTINWYPGHMEKAKRQMLERLKAVDMVIEVRDARIPDASTNPMLLSMVQNKPRVIILSKCDMADPVVTQQWIEKLNSESVLAIALDLMHDPKSGKKLVQACLKIMQPKRETYYYRNQLVLDISNPKVQDYVFGIVDRIMTENPDVAYFKWDCNSVITNIYSPYHKENQGNFYIDHVRGIYKVLTRIHKKYPKLPMMLCSGGGGRMDYEMLKYFTEFWCSDDTDPYERLYIQWSLSKFFPAKTMGSHVTNWNKNTSVKFRTDVCSSCKLGFDIDLKSLSGDEYKFVQNAVKNYDSMKPMILEGDQYRLVSPYEGNHCAINYVSKDKQRAVLFAYDLHPRYKEPVMNVKMQGLDADKVYTVKETNLMPGKESDLECNGKQYSGDYLMKVGLNVFSQTDGTSHVLVLE